MAMREELRDQGEIPYSFKTFERPGRPMRSCGVEAHHKLQAPQPAGCLMKAVAEVED
jgi:hypothetical protein